jgi:hypothetical protein
MASEEFDEHVRHKGSESRAHIPLGLQSYI